MRAIDTNVLVRLLVRDDTRQVAAAEQFTSNGAWISHVVLVETIWVLDSVYERTRDQCATVIERLLEHATLALQDPDAVESALDMFKSSAGTGFSDCLIVATARKAGHLPVGTFDRQLSKSDDTERLR